jgi:MFS family permease
VLRRLRGLAIDIGPLRRHREFRLLYIGQAVSFAGSMITYVAIPYQVYELTGSTFVVGLLGLAQIAPLLVTALIGGALADAHDRRRLVLIADVMLLLLALALLGNALLAEPHVWALFVIASGMAAASGLQRPSLDSMVPRLVPRDELPAAAALEGFRRNAGQIAGPAVGGILIASAGLGATYAVDAASFLVSLVALARMRAVPPPAEAAPPSLARIAEGWRYARRRQDLLGSYLVDINAMLFAMPVALFPAVADRFGGAEVLGLLFAAGPAGALALTLTSGWTARVTRHGRAIAVSAALTGVAIGLFGLVGSLPLALLLLAAAGAADMSSALFRAVLWNQTIPDDLRGRLAGIEQLSYSIGPTLGTTQAGAVAAITSPRTALLGGGFLCVAGTIVICALMPRFWRYDSVLEVPPVREDHADPGGIGRLHDLEVPLRPAGLDHRGDPGLDGELRAVREREEGI